MCAAGLGLAGSTGASGAVPRVRGSLTLVLHGGSSHLEGHSLVLPQPA